MSSIPFFHLRALRISDAARSPPLSSGETKFRERARTREATMLQRKCTLYSSSHYIVAIYLSKKIRKRSRVVNKYFWVMYSWTLITNPRIPLTQISEVPCSSVSLSSCTVTQKYRKVANLYAAFCCATADKYEAAAHSYHAAILDR